MVISAGAEAVLFDSASFGWGSADSGDRPLRAGLVVENDLLARTFGVELTRAAAGLIELWKGRMREIRSPGDERIAGRVIWRDARTASWVRELVRVILGCERVSLKE